MDFGARADVLDDDFANGRGVGAVNMERAGLTLAEIKPKERKLIIELVRDAGIDVSDWSNVKGGRAKAPMNPKYCYEWSFVKPGELVVLNLWLNSMDEKDGIITQRLNMRSRAAAPARGAGAANWKRRALNMDRAIEAAYSNQLPVRVVVCDGKMRDASKPDAKASQVTKRLLDPVTWAVTSYDTNTGDCILVRGAPPARMVDQFSVEDTAAGPVPRRTVISEGFDRRRDVRERVLARSGGRCEWCSQLGFVTAKGEIFLETHHVVPLSEGGPDIDSNVVALCPNHHREAHLGRASAEIRNQLLARQGGRAIYGKT